ncbi:MAG: hypothetical protein RI980_1746 [Bacteroidota bacterium]|jgi:CRISPR/Cas system-associated endoribonuclease Cas2
MILLITYDLKKPGKDYTALYNVIKTAPKWWHYLESTWIIQTPESVDTWNSRLTKVLDQNDHILIVDITKRPRQGWLPKEAWDWIRTNENV